MRFPHSFLTQTFRRPLGPILLSILMAQPATAQNAPQVAGQAAAQVAAQAAGQVAAKATIKNARPGSQGWLQQKPAEYQPEYQGVVALDLSLATMAISAWGISQWGWFKHSPVAKTEEWFGSDTSSGGADKTGHLYMSYVLSELFLWDFKRHGVKKPERKAALSALAAMTLVELGDATSDKFGFSSEDLVADAVGVAASWWLGSNPVWDDRIDLRMEYWPSNGYNLKNDAVSDYSGMKHLVALRADGFQSLRNTPMKWLELQAGYYTRGFRTFDEEDLPTRHTYVGLGISLPVLAGKKSKIGKVLSYVQPPGFYLEADKQF